MGSILTDVLKKIGYLDRAGPVALGKGYRTPGGLRGWLLCKNDVLRIDVHGLPGSEIKKPSSEVTSRTLISLKMELRDKPRPWIFPNK